MTSPDRLRQPLADLLTDIESQNQPQAISHAKSLIEELETPASEMQPKISPGDAPVRFSGLYHAMLREIRRGERHIVAGNWSAAAKSVRDAISVLPDRR